MPELDKVLIPAGATGNLMLMDPRTGTLTAIPGGAAPAAAGKGRGEGTTSAVYGAGYLFASDHDPAEVVVINPRSKAVIERIKLQGGPDYVRFVSSRNELWVTEPEQSQIEVLRFEAGAKPVITRETTISIAGGPDPRVRKPMSAGRGRRALSAVTGYPKVSQVLVAPAGVWMLS